MSNYCHFVSWLACLLWLCLAIPSECAPATEPAPVAAKPDASAPPSPFREKPAWWDRINMKIPPAGQSFTNLSDYLSWLIENNDLKGKEFTKWAISGPFETRKYPMDRALPPESGKTTGKYTVDKDTYQWMPWETGKECPLKPTQNASYIYAVTTRTVTFNTNIVLVITAADTFRVLVDDKLMHHQGIATTNPVFVHVPLSPGQHDILLKIHQPKGAWMFRLGENDFSAMLREAKLRAMAVYRFPDVTATCSWHAARLAEIFLAMDDLPNFSLWAERTLKWMDDPAQLTSILNGWSRFLAVSPVSSGCLDSLERMVQTFPENKQKIVYDTLANTSITLADPARASKYMLLAGRKATFNEALAMIQVCQQNNTPGSLAPWLIACVEASGEWEVVQRLRDIISKTPDAMLTALHPALVQCFISTSNETKKLKVAEVIADNLISRGDGQELRRFLLGNQAFLQSKSSVNWGVWNTELAIMDFDEPAAQAMLKQLESDKKLNPNDLNRLRARATQMEARTGAPANNDISIETIQINFMKLAASDDKTKLHQLIRDTLSERGIYTLPSTNDRMLFVGSKTMYRDLFKDHINTYQPYLATYTNLLAQNPGFGPEAAARISSIASLGNPPPTFTPRTLENTAAFRKEAMAQFTPCIELPPGTHETIGNSERFLRGAETLPMLYGTVANNDCFIVQNSRSIACFRKTSLLWHFIYPASPVWTSQKSRVFTSMRFTPAVCRNIVAARLQRSADTLTLHGFEQGTGRLLWTWGDIKSTLSSSPAAWRKSFVILTMSDKDQTENRTSSLAVLDALTGKLVRSIPVSLGPTAIPSDAWNKPPLDFFDIAPAPTVDGDSVYIDTSAGVVACINLMDESIQWLRIYPRQMNNRTVANHLPSSPILSPKNVLFAPLESSALMLLDRKTGEQVAKNTSLPWQEVQAAGPGAVAVITPGALSFLSMGDLSDLKTYPGNSFRFAQSLNDGCAIASSNSLMTFDGKGRPVATVDKGNNTATPLAACKDTVYAVGGDGEITVGVMGASRWAIPLLRPESNLFCSAMLPQIRSLVSSSGALVTGGGILRRLDANGKSLWDTVLPDGGFAAQHDDIVAAEYCGKVWFHNEKTGALMGAWPPTGSKSSILMQDAMLSGSNLYALASFNNKTTLYQLPLVMGAPARAIGILPGKIREGSKWFVVENRSRCTMVCTLDDGSLSIMALNTPGSSPLTTFEAQTTLKGDSGTLWYSSPSATGVLLNNNEKSASKITANGIDVINIPSEDKNLWSRLEDISSIGDIIRTRNDKSTFFYHPFSGASLTRKNGDNTPHHVANNCFYGITEINKQYQPYRVDLSKNSTQQLYDPLSLPGVNRDTQIAGAIVNGATTYLLFRDNWNEPVRYAVILDDKKKSSELRPFLAIPASSGINPVKPDLYSIGSHIVPKSDFQALLDLSPTILKPDPTSLDEEPAPRVDGYLDDWKDAEFMKTSLGRLALRRVKTPNEYWLALEIRDRKLIEKFCARGMEGALEIIFTTGPGANFGVDSISSNLKPFIPETGKTVEGWDFAYSITPNASVCQIELRREDRQFNTRRPGKDGQKHKKDKNKHSDMAELSQDALDLFGDLAVRFLWRSGPEVVPVNLLESRLSGPFSFTRIRTKNVDED